MRTLLALLRRTMLRALRLGARFSSRPPRLRTLLVGATMVLTARPAAAQNEASLRAALEGRTVTVKIDMPATNRGIDVYPEQSMPIDWREVAQRMKDNGTALKVGQTMMITKVVVKKDSHIEVQLGGGGYGTFGDYVSNSSSVSASAESESAHERSLRDSIKTAPNAARKKQLERELSNARSERERENSRARAEAAQANEAREANLRVKRAESGSRFNVRYRSGIPAAALTPEGVMAALTQYAEFNGQSAPVNASKAVASTALAPGAPIAGAVTVAAPSATSGNALLSVKKGLSVAEVEALLGPANTASERKEGALTVLTRNYAYEGKKVVSSFVNGVLIDYAIAPM